MPQQFKNIFNTKITVTKNKLSCHEKKKKKKKIKEHLRIF